ncbi:MAG: helix-turn-helix domain-containing protein [Bdellovibrionaceae bacterium]|nr:helix-turn-helix domain-containing protein [Pseudobdellovibrionaceae bacterium]
MFTAGTDPFFNYYEILEVEKTASLHEIYQAYARIKKTYSLRNPDIFKNFTFDELQELLVLIEEAYATIGNKDTREIYDQKFSKIFPDYTVHKTHFIEDSTPVKTVEDDHAASSSTLQADLIPSGYANTPLSSYKVDETFERLISHQDFFDGTFLGKIRKYKNVSLEDLSKYSCISMKYLYALEDNNYSALPAGVFTRGYVSQYCKVLSLDCDKVIPSFMKLFNNERK